MLTVITVGVLLLMYGTTPITSQSASMLLTCQGSVACVPVPNCESVFRLLQNKTYNNVDLHKYLRTIHCGFDNATPYICCPAEGIPTSIYNQQPQVATTDIPSTTVPDNKRPAAGFSLPLQPNQKHPNTNSALGPAPTTTSNKTADLDPENRYLDNPDRTINSTQDKRPPPKHVPATTAAPTERPLSSQSSLLPDHTLCGLSQNDYRIFGGQLTDIFEYPWTVRLRIKDKASQAVKYACAGVLISKRYVLTAAHCVNSGGLRTVEEVRLGEWNSATEVDCDDSNICNNAPVDIPLEEIIIHGSFNLKTRTRGDIALLRLASPVTFNDFIQPICLPTTSEVAKQSTTANSTYWTTGWGKTEYASDSPIKRKAMLKSITTESCQNIYNTVLKTEDLPGIICTIGKNGADSCAGDSGGPLMAPSMEGRRLNWYLFGIVSFGHRVCGTEGYPSVNTNVYAYISWIIKNMRE